MARTNKLSNKSSAKKSRKTKKKKKRRQGKIGNINSPNDPAQPVLPVGTKRTHDERIILRINVKKQCIIPQDTTSFDRGGQPPSGEEHPQSLHVDQSSSCKEQAPESEVLPPCQDHLSTAEPNYTEYSTVSENLNTSPCNLLAESDPTPIEVELDYGEFSFVSGNKHRLTHSEIPIHESIKARLLHDDLYAQQMIYKYRYESKEIDNEKKMDNLAKFIVFSHRRGLGHRQKDDVWIRCDYIFGLICHVWHVQLSSEIETIYVDWKEDLVPVTFESHFSLVFLRTLIYESTNDSQDKDQDINLLLPLQYHLHCSPFLETDVIENVGLLNEFIFRIEIAIAKELNGPWSRTPTRTISTLQSEATLDQSEVVHDTDDATETSLGDEGLPDPSQISHNTTYSSIDTTKDLFSSSDDSILISTCQRRSLSLPNQSSEIITLLPRSGTTSTPNSSFTITGAILCSSLLSEIITNLPVFKSAEIVICDSTKDTPNIGPTMTTCYDFDFKRNYSGEIEISQLMSAHSEGITSRNEPIKKTVMSDYGQQPNIIHNKEIIFEEIHSHSNIIRKNISNDNFIETNTIPQKESLTSQNGQQRNSRQSDVTMSERSQPIIDDSMECNYSSQGGNDEPNTQESEPVMSGNGQQRNSGQSDVTMSDISQPNTDVSMECNYSPQAGNDFEKTTQESEPVMSGNGQQSNSRQSDVTMSERSQPIIDDSIECNDSPRGGNDSEPHTQESDPVMSGNGQHGQDVGSTTPHPPNPQDNNAENDAADPPLNNLTLAKAEPEIQQKALTAKQVKAFFMRAKCSVGVNDLQTVINAKPGEVYLFYLYPYPFMKARDTLCEMDGLVWRNNGGHGNSDEKIHKLYHKALRADDSKSFSKVTYILNDEPFAIIHYKGELGEDVIKSSRRGRKKKAVMRSQVLQELATETLTDNVETENVETDNVQTDRPDVLSTANPQTMPMENDPIISEGNSSHTMTDEIRPTVQETILNAIGSHESRVPVDGQPFYLAAEPIAVLSSFKKRLPNDVIESIFQNTEDRNYLDASCHYINDPQHGQLYLFHVPPNMSTYWEKNLLKDTFRWKVQTAGKSNVPSFVSKKYYIVAPDENQELKSNAQFQRYTYYHVAFKKVIIHYFGDDDIRLRAPHGNSITGKLFIPSSSYVANKIKASLDKRTRDILLEERSKRYPGLVGDVLSARDRNQVKYYKAKEKSYMKLLGTESENAHHIAVALGPEIVKNIETFPTMSVLMMSNKIIDEVSRMVEKTRNDPTPFVFHYDTTFNCGKYYVSMLTVRHRLLQHVEQQKREVNGEPNIVLAMHIHQRKDAIIHIKFMTEVLRLLDDATKGEYSSVPKVLVIDQEFNQRLWPTDFIVYCWRHLLSNIEFKMKELGIHHDYKGVVNDFYNLAKSSSLQSFKSKLQDCLNSGEFAWANASFCNYFQSHTARIIEKYSGRWILKGLNIPFCDNGLTNNPAEGSNTSLKGWIDTFKQFKDDRTNIELYHVMLGAYKLSCHESIKITMAHYGHSPEYTLKDEFSNLTLPAARMPALSYPTVPEIIEEIKGLLGERTSDGDVGERNKSNEDGFHALLVHARDVYENSTIELVPQEQKFKVTLKSLEEYMVTLGQRPSCTCNVGSTCAHILAVRKAAGIDTEVTLPKTLRKKVPQQSHPKYKPSNKPSGKAPKRADFFDGALPSNRRDKFPKRQKEDKRSRHSSTRPTVAGNSPTSYEETQDVRREMSDNRYRSEIERNAHLYSRTNMRMGQSTSSTFRSIETPAERNDVQTFDAACEFSADLNIETIKTRIPENMKIQIPHPLGVGDDEFIRSDIFGDFGLVSLGPRRVVLITQKLREEQISYAAQAVQHQQTSSTLISVAVHLDPVPEVEIDRFDETELGVEDWHTLQPLCHCRRPTPIEETEDMLRCSSCFEYFHEGCIPHKKTNFTCAACECKDVGAKGGAGPVKSTCTIDNIFTSIVLRSTENKEFRKHMKGFKYSDKDTYQKTRKCFDFAMNAEWAKVQCQWNSLRLSKCSHRVAGDTFTMFGHPEAMFFDVVKEGGEFQSLSFCKRCKEYSRSLPTHIFMPNSNLPIRTALQERTIGSGDLSLCPHCQQEAVEDRGLVKVTEKTPWFLHFDLSGTAYTFREALQCPTEILVPDVAWFKLSHITLSTPGHFSAVLFHKGQFLSYDDQKTIPIARFLFSSLQMCPFAIFSSCMHS